MASEPGTSLSCPACDLPLLGRFCHDCGQDTTIRPRPLREIVSQALSDITNIDGKTARTVATLAVRPGRLLEAYRDGASGRYATPLKMFVMMTAVFLSVLNFTEVQIYQNIWTLTPGVPAVATADPDGVTVHITGGVNRDLWMERRVDPQVDPGIYPALTEAASRATNETDRQNLLYEATFAEEQPLVTERLSTWMSNAVWLMMPLYALLLIPLFGRRMMMEHLAFAMWAHAMAFALLLLLALANRLWGGMPAWPLLIPYLVYFTLAASRFYGVSPVGAAWRSLVHIALYVILVLVPAAAVVTLVGTDIGAYLEFLRA